jgi:hypothetical protein
VTEREIDIAVRDIVVKAFDRATEVLRNRRGDLYKGAHLLLTQETVTADQFPAILSQSADKVCRVNFAGFDHRGIESPQAQTDPAHQKPVRWS